MNPPPGGARGDGDDGGRAASGLETVDFRGAAAGARGLLALLHGAPRLRELRVSSLERAVARAGAATNPRVSIQFSTNPGAPM